MQDVLNTLVFGIAIAFSTLVVFDLAVNLAHLWSQSKPEADQPEDYIDALDFELDDYTLTEKDLELIARACSEDTPSTSVLPDPWTLATEEVIATAAPRPVAQLPTLQLLPPAKVQQTKRALRSKKEVQTKVQKPVQTVAPKRRGRPRKTA